MSNTALVSLKNQLNNPTTLQALRDAVPTTAARYLTPERIVRIVTLAASRNPKLLACDMRSVLSSVIDCVQMGLEPGGALQHAYLVPYGQQCTLVIGYQGYIALARRSGEIDSIFCQVAYKGDKFRVTYGSSPSIVHEPMLEGNCGEPIAVYCVAKFKGGGEHIEVMTVGQIEAVRQRSKASGAGPWVTDWEQMARKTVIRRARHYWPVSVEMAQAAAIEDQVERGAFSAVAQVIDAAPVADEPKPATKKLLGKIKGGAAEKKPDEDSLDYGPPAMDEPAVANG